MCHHFLKLNLLVISFFVFSTHIVIGQDHEGPTGGGSQLPVVKDPSAFQFSQTGFSTIDYFTGTPNIEIPLHEIKLKNFVLPIKLAYSSSEIKPTTVTGFVGLGWKLIAGGSVSRILNDVPDDVIMRSLGGEMGHGYKYGYIYGGKERADYIKSRLDNRANIGGIQLEADIVNYAFGMFLRTDGNYCAPQLFPTIDKGYHRGYDTGPDWFSMSVNGRSSQFLLDSYQSRSIRFIVYDNKKGRYALDSTYHPYQGISSYTYMKGITSFTVTDEYGNQFVFAQPDKIRVFGRTRDVFFFRPDMNSITSNDYFGATGLINEYYSEWHLSSIITPYNERIDFEYEEENVVLYQKSYYSRELDTTIDYTTVPFNVGMNDAGIISNDKMNLTRIEKKQHRLKKIVSGFTVIDFSVLEQRPDLLSSFYLNTINISTNNSGNIRLDKSYSLEYAGPFLPTDPNYSYTPAGTGNDPNYYWMMASTYFPDDRFSGPLFYPLLRKLEESVSSQRYLFNYNIPTQSELFPAQLIQGLDAWAFYKNSFDVDHWGYYNHLPPGPAPPGSRPPNKNPFPTIYVHPTLNGPDRFTLFPLDGVTPEYTLAGANRNCDTNSITIGILKDILYPTGGMQSFEFESNQFFYKGANRFGGGTRIKRMQLRDSTGRNVYTKRYEYNKFSQPGTTSGHLFNMPMYAYNDNMPLFYTRFLSNTKISPGTTFASNPAAYYNSATWRCEQPYFIRGDFEMSTVGYANVREYLEANNDRGYSDYEFSVPASIDEPLNDELGLFKQPALIPLRKSVYYGISSIGQCDQPGSVVATIEPTTGTALLNYIDSAQNTFGVGPVLNYDWNRGHLLSRKKYEARGYLMEKEEFEYDFFQKDAASSRYPGINVVRRPNAGLWEPVAFEDYFYAISCSPYEFITNVKRVLRESRKTSYEPFQASRPDSLVIRKRFIYDGNGQIKEAIVYSSDGGNYTTHNKYPYDYTSGSINDPVVTGIKNRVSGNMIADPVEAYTIYTNPANVQTIIEATIQFFHPQKNVVDSVKQIAAIPMSSFTPSGTSLVGGSYKFLYSPNYIKGSYFDAYDASFNLTQHHEDRQKNTVYLWNYNGQYMTAQTINATFQGTAHESFESAIGVNGFTVSIAGGAGLPFLTDPLAPTGKMVLNLAKLDSISKTIPDPQQTYIVSCWLKDGTIVLDRTTVVSHTIGKAKRGWAYHEFKISGGNKVRIRRSSTAGTLDELRFYPANAMMTTYTYEPNLGITSICERNNIITYYKYDIAGRLASILNDEGNILKQFCYSYYNSSGDCVVQQVQSQETSKLVARSDADTASDNTIVYVKLVVDNRSIATDEYFTATYSDIYINFYQDEACSIPYTLKRSKKITLRKDQQLTSKDGIPRQIHDNIEVTAPAGSNKVFAGNYPEKECYYDLFSKTIGTCAGYRYYMIAGNGYQIVIDQ